MADQAEDAHSPEFNVATQPDDYDRLIRPIEPQMMRCVWRITQHPDDADDALQEALIRIWKQLPRIRSHPNPSALILRICSHAACDIVRSRSRWNRDPSLPDGSDIAAEASDAQSINSERRDQITAAIARLPERQAAAVSLRFILSCTYEDVAQALGCAVPTARVHVARGLARLRDVLTQFHSSPTKEN